jgi:hypothetical protein
VRNYTIVTFLWGHWELNDGGVCYVHALHEGVKRNLRGVPYRFVCFTDHKAEEFNRGIELAPFDCPDFIGNLKKMIVFRNDGFLTGRILALDLDTVVTGDILPVMDGIVQSFTTCECPYHLRWMGGGIHCFDAGFGHEELWQPLVTERSRFEAESRGSERLYLSYRFKSCGLPYDLWKRRMPGKVVSFKKECKWGESLPKDVRLVWFHGIPRPHQCMEVEWIRDHWLRGARMTDTASEDDGLGKPLVSGL